MRKQDIRAAIIARVATMGRSYSSWRIGLTHDPRERKTYWDRQNENTDSWTHWRADSLADAQEIESYFINETGMKRGPGGDLLPNETVFVYAF